ncbi:hypothetical protein B0T26DRAFT_77565 [Lasiosphaeria miniovina]|uniref:Zn(2)-C6 fungal-type domain-containing protein n=1 Tax=Lasiosphaeria miniovina TaxID=1954250 RepID=A0AA40BI27_9PEZI|nr:uncharacterized protein B0T26DRAFT_77565 [Lasiosphaeria miniovina]KAK0734634.1 hypothetical protein B0T26DRAFT_77565 [Lasiosphaeria miniovina]
MPISRKKACSSCRGSKTRCSLDLPCARCVQRHLRCAYERVPAPAPALGQGHGPYRKIARSAAPLSPRAGQGHENDADARQVPSHGPWHLLPGPWHLPLGNDVFEDLNAGDLPNTVAADSLPASATSCEVNTTGTVGYLDQWESSSMALPPPTSDNAPQPLGTLSVQPLGTSSVQPLGSTLSVFQNPGTLSQRKIAKLETYLSSKVLFGQMMAYPQMMTDGSGRLPPFIHPQCVLDGRSATECTSRGSGNHTCLPETLATCTSLLHMFFTRTAASSDFVWKTIFDHQRQIRCRTPSLDVQELVEAIQATVMYILIQALDLQTIQKNDARSLVTTTSEIGTRLHLLNGYQGIADGVLSRREWVTRESARRTICLLYGIERVFDVIFSSSGRDFCAGHCYVPLPSPRYLWEPVDNVTWTARYQKHNSMSSSYSSSARRQPGTCLVMQDLWRLRQERSGTIATCESASDAAGREGTFRDLEHWCETIDEFGSLVWMAAMMDGA